MKKYTCTNCDTVPNNNEIDPMIKAGYDLRHLACPTCGQQALAPKEPIKFGH